MLATFAAFGSCGILFQGLDCLEEEVAEQTTCWILQDAYEAGDTLWHWRYFALLSFQFWVVCPSCYSSLRMISPLQKEAVKAWHSNPSISGVRCSHVRLYRGFVSGILRDMPKCTVFFENIIVGLAWWHALIRNCGTADGFGQEILPDNGPPRCFWAAIMEKAIPVHHITCIPSLQ